MLGAKMPSIGLSRGRRKYGSSNSWDIPTLHVGKAQFLIDVSVDGNRVNWIDSKVRTPDSESFQHAKKPPWKTVSEILFIVFIALIFIWIGKGIFATAYYRVPWRWGYWAAGVSVPIVLTLGILNIPALGSISATESPTAFVIRTWLEILGSTIGIALVLLLLVPAFIALWAEVFPHIPGPRTWLQALLSPGQHAAVWRTALLAQFPLASIALVSVVISMAFYSGASALRADVRIPNWLLHAGPWVIGLTPGFQLSPFAKLEISHPILFLLLFAFFDGATTLLMWLGLLAIGKRYHRTTSQTLIILGIGIILVGLMNAQYWQEIGQCILMNAVVVFALWVAYRLLLRSNPLILVVSVTTAVLLAGIHDLLWFPTYRPAAITIGAVLAVVYLWALVSAGMAAWRARHEQQLLPQPAEIPGEELAGVEGG